MRPFADLAGRKFGHLVAVSSELRGRRRYWECRCECGTVKRIRHDGLLAGDHTSCGCLKGFAHGGTGTPEHKAWCNMIERCHTTTHREYRRYGGRGIEVCQEWRESFIAFLRHIGPRPSRKHSVDRIDNNDGYRPGNVRWATARQQAHNRRGQINEAIAERVRKAKGKQIEIAQRFGIHPSTVSRIKSGEQWASI